MKKLYLTLVLGWLCAFASLSQPADLVLSSAESGTKLHQATNSITFAAGYSYTPSGGTMTAEIVSGGGSVGDTQLNPIIAGQYSSNFQYTNTQNTTSFTNQFTSRPANDVFYKFTLAQAMEVTMTHCGSALSDTYMHLLDALGNLIASNDDYSGEDQCSTSLHSFIRRELAAGTYYVVSEAFSGNGLIQTNISGIAIVLEGSIAGNIGYSSPIDPSSYSINTTLAVGSIPGRLNIGGSADYSMPVEIPNGTNSLQPSINLNYNSNFIDGPLGIGWNIAGLSSIDRINKTYYYDNKSERIKGDLSDVYALDGERMLVASDTYGADNSVYGTELEESSKIVAHGATGQGPEFFRVYTKSGLIYEYGNTTDSKVKRGGSCILSWKLNKITDRYNNFITYSYIASDDEHPIGKIEYSGNSDLSKDPFAHVLFNYKYRDDISSYIYGGKEFTRDILLDNIVVRNNTRTYKKYQMSYMKDNYTQLLKVTESTSGGQLLNPVVFAWTKQTEQFTQPTLYSNSLAEYFIHGDFNGDGRGDYVIIPAKSTYSSSDKWRLYFANSSGNMIFHKEGYLNSNLKTFLVADYNGDGITDMMMISKDNKCTLYQSNGDTFVISDSSWNATYYSQIVVDYDGDGKMDILSYNNDSPGYGEYGDMYYIPPTPAKYKLYKYTGEFISEGELPSFGKISQYVKSMVTHLCDLTGDKRSDILCTFSTKYKIYEFDKNTSKLVLIKEGNNLTNQNVSLTGDFNGDGITDILKMTGANPTFSLLCYVNNELKEHPISGISGFNMELVNNGINGTFDFNGDGKSDFIIMGRGKNITNSMNRINLAINKGSGLEFEIKEYISTTDLVLSTSLYCSDYNGDGRDQIFYYRDNAAKLYSFASGTPSNLLSTVIDGLGAKTTITYKPMTNASVYEKYSTNGSHPFINYISPMQLVSQVDTDNGLGGIVSTTYRYEGAKAHLQGKGIVGFSKMTETTLLPGNDWRVIRTFDFHPSRYFAQDKDVISGYWNGTNLFTVQTVTNNWDEISLPNNRVFPYIALTSETDHVRGPSTSTTYNFNTFGSGASTYVNLSSISKSFDTGGTKTTSYGYTSENTSTWLIGRPTTITETSVRDSQTKTFTTSRTYFPTNNSPDIDNYNSGDPTWWKLDRAYDGFGNLSEVKKETTGLSAQTTVYTYDTGNGVNLMKVTDPAGNETNYTYDPTLGKVKTITDPLGNLVTYNYNNKDQLSSVVPTEGITTTMTSSMYVTGGPANARFYIQKFGADGSKTKTWFDKLGREIRNESNAFNGDMVKVDKKYNDAGQLHQVSEPSSGTPSLWSEISYDPENGLIAQQDPYFGPTTSLSHTSYNITRTVNGRTYQTEFDNANLVTKRTDPGGSITYTYWPDGKLKSTLAPGNLTTSMTYDKNGNRLTIDDPSSGIITNTWYGTGQPNTVKNADNESSTYIYETNGLLDKYTAPEGTTDYSYNTNKLVSNITSPEGVSRSYTYEAGKIKTVTESIDGISNLITFNYDSKGRLSRKYFNGGTDYEQYDYNANGYLYRIQFNGTTVWQLTGMDEYGHITNANIGSTAATWDYDSNKLLSGITATGVQDYDYSFDVNTGNLNSRTNFLKSKTETFSYGTDKLDCLASVSGPASIAVSYTSDKNGNILTKSDAGTYSAYDGYAVRVLSYVQNISTTPQTINYYSFEKVKDITEGTKKAEFVYNADQQRIRMTLKTSGTTTKTRWYFGGSCEREQVGSTVTQYIWIGGDAYTAVAVAKKIGTGSWTVYNIFRDHLGSITHLKNASTGVVDEYSFDAWGRRRDKDDWTYTLSSEPALFADRGFTAHEFLPDFNLYNMNGRMYDPVVGRFLSPDPFIQAPDFTQSFNRYSYCLNNPLKYSDPSGYTWLSRFGNWWSENLSGVQIGTTINGGQPMPFASTQVAPGTNVSVGYNFSTNQWGLGNNSSGFNQFYYPEKDYAAKYDNALNNIAQVRADHFAENGGGGKGTFDKFNFIAGAKATGASTLLDARLNRLSMYRPLIDNSGVTVYRGASKWLSAFKASQVVKGLGFGLTGLGIGYDYLYGVPRYNQGIRDEWAVNPLKADLNTVVAAYSLFVNPFLGLGYFGVDAFYPGGWPAALQDQDRLILNTQRTLGPTWNPYRGPQGPLN